MSSHQWISLATVLFLAVATPAADPTPLQPTHTWKGPVDDRKLAKEMPENGVITNAKDFEKLVKAWNVAEKVPEVNFDKEIVLVGKTDGSILTLNPVLNEKGDLKAAGFASQDLVPGFRY